MPVSLANPQQAFISCKLTSSLGERWLLSGVLPVLCRQCGTFSITKGICAPLFPGLFLARPDTVFIHTVPSSVAWVSLCSPSSPCPFPSWPFVPSIPCPDSIQQNSTLTLFC